MYYLTNQIQEEFMFFSSKDVYYLVKRCVEKIVLNPEAFQFGIFIGAELGLMLAEENYETILNFKMPLSEDNLTRMSINGLEIEDLWIVARTDMRDHFVE